MVTIRRKRFAIKLNSRKRVLTRNYSFSRISGRSGRKFGRKFGRSLPRYATGFFGFNFGGSRGTYLRLLTQEQQILRLIQLKNLPQYLNSLGDLHDCTVTGANWDLARGEIKFQIEDLFRNFEGLQNYPGPTPGTILLSGVTKLIADFDSKSEGAIISEMEIVEESLNQIRVMVRFWDPVGLVTAICSSVVIASDEGTLWPSV